MTDKIDAAIRATILDDPTEAGSQAAPPRPLIEVPITLGRTTGAVVVVGVPVDITDIEVMDMSAWLLSSLRGHIAANLQPRLVVARGIVDR